MSQKTMEIYTSIVREIHLAVSSGDDMARIGVPGMILRKESLEKKLKLNPARQNLIFDNATADSPYRNPTLS